MPTTRIGKPRRHLFRSNFVGNIACLKPNLLVGDQRHRPDLAQPMAALAVILKDGQHVAIEGGRGRRLLRQLSSGEGNHQKQD